MTQHFPFRRATRRGRRKWRQVPRTAVASCVGLAALATLASCSEEIMGDDYGPPAGFAIVAGTVWHGGEPVVGAGVAVTACETPIGGLAGSATTDGSGAFSVQATLPPAGVIGIPDSLVFLSVICQVAVAQSIAVDSLAVPFYRTLSAVQPVSITISQ